MTAPARISIVDRARGANALLWLGAGFRLLLALIVWTVIYWLVWGVAWIGFAWWLGGGTVPWIHHGLFAAYLGSALWYGLRNTRLPPFHRSIWGSEALRDVTTIGGFYATQRLTDPAAGVYAYSAAVFWAGRLITDGLRMPSRRVAIERAEAADLAEVLNELPSGRERFRNIDPSRDPMHACYVAERLGLLWHRFRDGHLQIARARRYDHTTFEA